LPVAGGFQENGVGAAERGSVAATPSTPDVGGILEGAERHGAGDALADGMVEGIHLRPRGATGKSYDDFNQASKGK
jgi:hypothetical protein